MKFSGKITQLLIGTVACSIAFSCLAIELKAQITKATTIQIAQALPPEEINLRAKQTIVRIDGASVGSGSIIDYSDQVYTVLSNWHVMKNSGDYIVQTVDGRKHQVAPNSIKQIPGLDLAIFKFNSTQNYQITEIGDSDSLNEGQSVYFAGYPGELRKEDNRYYRFFPANLVGILPKSTENGYSLIYNGEAFPGMSGGPVFNQQGLMIGVHGEANVHALSGGTSNYAIPINTYKSAIAKLNTPAPTAKTSLPEPSSATVDNVASQPEAKSTPETQETTPSTPVETDNSNQSETSNSDSGEISSVPTFSPEPKQPKETTESQSESSETESTETTASEAETSEPKQSTETTASEAETSDPKNESSPQTTNSKPTKPQKPTLISRKTGIDYTKLRNLLKEEQWSEADIHTYKLIEQIVKTAKQQNKHVFIELKTIANFACSDIRTIDSLWQEYSNDKFGFSSQQEIWQSVNQKGDFSTQTWRQFATEVGWKKGEVASGGGYLLYEQLNFNPTKAPSGHLPWWFALPDEEQNVIKQLFARCNFNPTVEELEAEAEAEKPKKPNEKASNNQGEVFDKNQPNINKAPKSL